MIKNFLYLDEYKMYSLSSQVFEGITEYLISTDIGSENKSNAQKGPVGSGRILADILKKQHETTEKRYLHDYSYVLFEKHLIDEQQVFDVNIQEREDFTDSLNELPFIKIKGRATFNDIESIKNTLKNFNAMGEALAHVTNFKAIENARQQFEQAKANTKDRNKKSAIRAEFNRLTNIGKLAKESGLHQDQKFLENLEFLLSYGFQDQFEIQIECSKLIFSANLKREALREKEDLLIRKYARKTEVELVIFGLVSQYSERGEIETNEEDVEYENIKEALMNLVSHLSNMESTFTGRLSNEIVIDPIAVYSEL